MTNLADIPESQQCRATSKATGNRCRNIVPNGAVVCRFHGGMAPQALAMQQNRMTRRKAEQIAATSWLSLKPHTLKVLDELEENAKRMLAFRNAVEELVSLEQDKLRYEGKTGEQIRGEVTLYTTALRDVHKMLVDIERLGIANKRLELEKAQAILVAKAFRDAISDLTDVQKLEATQRFSVGMRKLAEASVIRGEIEE